MNTVGVSIKCPGHQLSSSHARKDASKARVAPNAKSVRVCRKSFRSSFSKKVVGAPSLGSRSANVPTVASGNGSVAAGSNGGSANGSSAPSGDVTVSVDYLKDITLKAIKTYGYTDQEANVMNDVMMYAQLRGNNQGIIKVTTGGIARTETCGRVEIEHETKLSALLNGNQDAGMLALSQATDMALEMAKEHGFGIVGTKNTPTSTGALGYYAKRVAEQGMIAMVLAQSPEFVAPHGAKEPIFGTNPIGVGIPTNGDPVILDMATSAYSFFGLLEAKTAGKSIPEGCAIDENGQPTTDPNEALKGAIQVFDRTYKGSNLALIVELLAGSLVGAAVEDKLATKSWGNLVAVVDPALLGPVEGFQARVDTVLNRVKGAAKVPGVTEILLPGERGDRIAKAREAANQIPVEPNLLKGLQDLAAKYTDQEGMEKAAAAAAAKPATKVPENLSMATQLVHPDKVVKDPYMATNVPIYQTATFAQPSATTFGEYDYTRSGNPTRHALEQQMAALEGAAGAYAFASGMTALAVVCSLVKQGGTIVAGTDIYGGTARLLSKVVPERGIRVVNANTANMAAMRAAITPETSLVILESPTNPRMQIIDIKAISEMAHAVGALVVVDNSIMTPCFQRCLDLGADMTMTSATKFICGHSDVTGGILACRTQELADKVYFLQNAEGASLAPFDCWLCIRGLKTMSLRMEKQAENALKIAEWLEAHPSVKKVNYPGLKSNAGYELHKSQCTSPGSLISFTTGDVEVSRRVVEETKLFKITVSFGNVGSLISLPCFMSHASIPKEVRTARGLPDDLVRISAGVEDIDDLIADLEQAMPGGPTVAAAALAPVYVEPVPEVTITDDDLAAQQATLMERIRFLEDQLSEGPAGSAV